MGSGSSKTTKLNTVSIQGNNARANYNSHSLVTGASALVKSSSKINNVSPSMDNEIGLIAIPNMASYKSIKCKRISDLSNNHKDHKCLVINSSRNIKSNTNLKADQFKIGKTEVALKKKLASQPNINMKDLINQIIVKKTGEAAINFTTKKNLGKIENGAFSSKFSQLKRPSSCTKSNVINAENKNKQIGNLKIENFSYMSRSETNKPRLANPVLTHNSSLVNDSCATLKQTDKSICNSTLFQKKTNLLTACCFKKKLTTNNFDYQMPQTEIIIPHTNGSDNKNNARRKQNYKTTIKLQPIKIQNYKYLLEKDNTPSTCNTLIQRKESLLIARRNLLDDLESDINELDANRPTIKKLNFSEKKICDEQTAKNRCMSGAAPVIQIKKSSPDFVINKFVESTRRTTITDTKKYTFSSAVALNKKERDYNDFVK